MASNLYLMSFIKPPEEGKVLEISFTEDLHLTLLSNFSIPDKYISVFSRVVREISVWTAPVTVSSSRIEMFGENKDIPAAIIENNELKNLHVSLMKELYFYSGQVEDERYSGENFNPHISHWNGIGELKLDSMTLVHHRGGFGVDVWAYHTYFFNPDISKIRF